MHKTLQKPIQYAGRKKNNGSVHSGIFFSPVILCALSKKAMCQKIVMYKDHSSELTKVNDLFKVHSFLSLTE